MSKKTFKKAVGGLYKNGLIEIKEDGIKLIRMDKAKMLHLFKFEGETKDRIGESENRRNRK